MKNKGLLALVGSICLVLILAVLPFMTACPAPQGEETTPPPPAGGETTTPPEEVPIILKYGSASCLSGPYAPWGIQEWRTQQMFFDDINKGGGCWGGIYGHEPGFRVGGKLYNWELISYDATFDPIEGAKVVNRLIYEDKVKFLHIFPAPALFASRSIIEEEKIFVDVQSYGKDLTGADYPRTFQFLQKPDWYIPAEALYFAENGFKTTCFIVEDSVDGHGCEEDWRIACDEYGIEVLSVDWCEWGQTEFVSMLTKIVALDPDFINMAFVAASQHGLIIKQARELGYEKPMQATPVVWSTLIDTCGVEAAEDVYSGGILVPPYPFEKQQWLQDEYTKWWGEDEWEGGIADRSDAPYFITQAIERANSLDTDEVARAMETLPETEMYSFWGKPCYWGGETAWGINHDLVSPFWFARIHNGKWEKLQIVNLPKGAY